MKVMDAAKKIMRQSGNMQQWTDGYPLESVIKSDIEKNGGFVVEEDNQIVGYFAFLSSPEPTYARIYEGKWLDDEQPYHVVHRIASYPDVHGIFSSIMDFCFSKEPNIRIDTHRDNIIMQHNIAKHGFTYCGIILLANGDERLAYQIRLSRISRFLERVSKEIIRNSKEQEEMSIEQEPILHKKTFQELTTEELYELLRVRSEVFVVEQNCVYQDLDGDDQQSIHLWLTVADKVVALSRVCPAGTHMKEISIGRVITTERGKGYGKQIMLHAIDTAITHFDAKLIDIEAQEYAKGFYEGVGFRQSSDTFTLDGIPHIKMTLRLESPEKDG